MTGFPEEPDAPVDADRVDRMTPHGPVPAFVAAHEDDLLALAADLVGFDTQNPPGDTTELIEFVHDYLTDLGLDAWKVTARPDTPNLIVTIPGARNRCLLFNGHVDTVPYTAEEWTYDPLGEIVGDRLYGRGATDMKGAVAAMLMTARAYAETDTTPPLTLRFAFVSEEETGGTAGLKSLVTDQSLHADACVIGEPTCEGGRHSVTVADRGSIWLTLDASGEAAHGSRPLFGVNAIDRLIATIEAIRAEIGTRELSLDPAITPIIEESVGFYADHAGEDAVRRLFTHPSINLGQITGGEAINTVPDSATAKLDIRLSATVDTEAVLSDLRTLVADHAGVAIADVSWSHGSYVDPDDPIVRAVVQSASAVTGERIYRRSATGGGDAKALRRAGIPTVEFAVGTDTVHGVDEYLPRVALAQTAQTYARLPAAFAAALPDTGTDAPTARE